MSLVATQEQVLNTHSGIKCVCGEGGDDVYSRQTSLSISSLLAKSYRVRIGKVIFADDRFHQRQQPGLQFHSLLKCKPMDKF